MFNLISLNSAKGLIPVALIALAGVAAYFLWSKAQANSAAANAANNAADSTAGLTSGDTSTLADLALLQSLMGNTSTTGSTTAISTSQPTYTAGVGGQAFTGSNAVSQPAPTTSGSSTGNTVPGQGV